MELETKICPSDPDGGWARWQIGILFWLTVFSFFILSTLPADIWSSFYWYHTFFLSLRSSASHTSFNFPSVIFLILFLIALVVSVHCLLFFFSLSSSFSYPAVVTPSPLCFYAYSFKSTCPQISFSTLPDNVFRSACGNFCFVFTVIFFSPDFFQSQITGKAYHFLFSVLPSSDTFYYYCELSGATRVWRTKTKLIRVAWLGCQNDIQSSLTPSYLLDYRKAEPSPKSQVFDRNTVKWSDELLKIAVQYGL